MIASTRSTQQKKLTLHALFMGVALLLSPLAQAKFACWTNHEGYKECGNSVPPEFAQKRTETFDSRGVKTEVKEKAKSRAQYEFEQEEAANKAAAEAEAARLQKIQDEKDRVLLSTFSLVEDIEAFKKRNLDQLDMQIKIAHIQIAQLKKNLTGYEKEALVYQRKRQPVPDTLQSNIDTVQGQIDNKNKYIALKESEKSELSAKYDADMARFRILKAQ